MTIYKQILLIVCLAVIILVTLTYLLSRFTLMDGLQDIEKASVQQRVEQTLNTISYFLSNMESINADWASWDDTYAFIEDENGSDYIASNLGKDTFTTLDINLMVYIHSSGRIVFSKAVDLDSQEEMPITDDLGSFIHERSRILKDTGFENPASGFILLDEGPMLISSQPILRSDDIGPSRGMLVFGRYFDTRKIGEISHLLGHPIDIIPVSEARMHGDVQRAVVSLSEGESIYTHPTNYQYAAGYALIEDVYDIPILVLRVNVTRDIYQTGQHSIFMLVLYILGSTLLIGAGCVFLLRKTVLSRLSRIAKNIDHIRETGDTTTSISVGGSDELTAVADTINNMLASLRWSYEQIKESAEKYRLIADNATDVILTADLQFSTIYVSPSVERLTGYSSEEIVGRPLTGILTPPSQNTIIKTLQEELAAEDLEQSDPSRIRTLEIEIERKDGTHIWCETSTTFLRSSEGKAIAILSVLHDVTERKEARGKLQALYEEETEIRQHLEEELERRIQFTRALVHELKTPITPVLVSSELLLEEVREGPLLRIAQNISEGASHLNQRIDELVDLAKTEIGTLEIRRDRFEPKPLLEDTYASLKPVAERNGQQLDMEIPASLGTVHADKERIRQTILNLINNALKFTPSGGKITLRAKREAGNLIVEVKDNGRGMTRAEKGNLFKPYYKTEDDRARLSGLGLGLYLSKNFVELQGGHIWVKSERGKGSKFSFSIPVESNEHTDSL